MPFTSTSQPNCQRPAPHNRQFQLFCSHLQGGHQAHWANFQWKSKPLASSMAPKPSPPVTGLWLSPSSCAPTHSGLTRHSSRELAIHVPKQLGLKGSRVGVQVTLGREEAPIACLSSSSTSPSDSCHRGSIGQWNTCLTLKRQVKQVQPNSPDFHCHIFIVPKASGGWPKASWICPL